MDGVTVAELRAGGEVEGVFACTRKDRLTARNGSPYLAVELRDRTGAIAGRAFRDADFLAGQFERGDLVSVRGRVERFRDELQVDVAAIRRAEDGAADPAEFLPVAYRDMEELDGFLEHLAREVHDPDLRALLDAFLGDERFRADFRRAPCTRGGHHAYLGGLLEHTVAVSTLAFGDGHAPPAAEHRSAAERGDPARHREDPRVRPRRRDRSRPRRARSSATSRSGSSS